VAPQARGHGVGRTLLQACMARARRDHGALIALHTTPVMGAAQRLYLRQGFEVLRELPAMYGVPYVLMARSLSD
jgi:ribosomal protein S18 acetylase RimI-like enzyme